MYFYLSKSSLMKNKSVRVVIALIAIVCALNSGYAQTGGDDIYTAVEVSPKFAGGDAAMNQFLAKNLKYPREALEKNIQGTVYVSFIVEKDGSIKDATIKRDIGAGCGQEAIRVIKMMPNWTPGKQRGKAVRTQFILPIAFKLS